MSSRSRSRIAATWAVATLAVVLWLGSARSAHAQRSLVEAAVHLKVLAYDRNLVTNGRKRIVLGVLSLARPNQAQPNQRDQAFAFRQLSRKVTVQGIPVAVVVIPVDGASLERRLSEARVDAIYVSSTLGQHTATIARIAAARKLPTLCGSSSQVSAGLAVAVDMSGKKPQLIVNLGAARRSGMDLSARVLRMARILKPDAPTNHENLHQGRSTRRP